MPPILRTLKKFFVDDLIERTKKIYFWCFNVIGMYLSFLCAPFKKLYVRSFYRIGKDGRVGLMQLNSSVVIGCNLQCEYCSVFSPYLKGYAPADELIDSWMEWRKKLKPRYFVLNGGEPYYDVLYNDPDHVKTKDAFVRGMGKFTKWQSRVVAKSYDFKSVKKVVDVAGGSGFLISRILQTHPHLKGAMVDLPFSIEQAKTTATECGVADRLDLVVGNIFEAATFPNDGDLYTLKHVLWDWDDAHALKILQNIRKVIPPHAKLMIIENAISSKNDLDGLAKLVDLDVMFFNYGKSRTKEEWLKLTHDAGFSLERIKPTSQFDIKLMTFLPVD